MKTTPLSLLFTGLLSLTVVLGCSDKDDDDDTGSSSDGGADDGGSDDGGSSDGGDDGGEEEDEFLEPTGLYINWGDAILASAHGNVLSAGTPIPSAFYLYLATDDWDYSFEDDDEFCAFEWLTDTAAVTADITQAWNGMQWTVDTSIAPSMYGACLDLDPDVWGANPSAAFMGADVAYGYGPDEDGITTKILEYYAESYGWTEANVWGAYLMSTALLGDATPFQWGWTIGFAADSTSGELLDDGAGGSVWAEVDGPFPPDAYYQAQWAYYFPY